MTDVFDETLELLLRSCRIWSRGGHPQHCAYVPVHEIMAMMGGVHVTSVKRATRYKKREDVNE